MRQVKIFKGPLVTVLQEVEDWRSIDALIVVYQRRADIFSEDLRAAGENGWLEARDSTIPQNDYDLAAGYTLPGTKEAIEIAAHLKQEALAVHLLGDPDLQAYELDLYRTACKLNPHDTEAIWSAAQCFREMGEYDRCVKKLVHLAVIAKDNNDYALAKQVLDNHLIDRALLALKSAEPVRAANQNTFTLS